MTDITKVYAACPQCISFVRKEDVKKASETVESHNQSRHNCDPVAITVKDRVKDTNDFVDHAKDVCGGEQYRKLLQQIVSNDTPLPPTEN